MSTVFTGILVAVLLRPAISEYLVNKTEQNPEASIRLASTITGEDARYPYALGLLSHQARDKTGLEKAESLYLESLRRDPTRALAWLDLSRVYGESGLDAQAEYAVKRAVAVDHANPNVLWEAGMFYLLNGRLAEAAPFFRTYLDLIPGEHEQVVTLLQGVGARAGFIMEKIIPETDASRSRYFRFLLNYKQYAELWDVWEIRKIWSPSRKEYLTFCDFLVEKGELEAAQPVWREFADTTYPAMLRRDSANIVFNGEFEYTIQDGGFDWKIGKAEGVSVTTDPDVKNTGAASLAVTFSGKTNPGIYLAQQVVRVRPNEKYRVVATVKTENLTTRNGILLEVLDQKGGSWTARSEILTGTSSWQPVELTFATPATCNAVKLGIKRERSDRFDNKISGKAWIDSVRMTQLTTGKN